MKLCKSSVLVALIVAVLSSVTQGVEGRYLWVYDGKAQVEADAFIEGFVLGHQMHAQIIFMDRLHDHCEKPVDDDYEGVACQLVK